MRKKLLPLAAGRRANTRQTDPTLSEKGVGNSEKPVKSKERAKSKSVVTKASVVKKVTASESRLVARASEDIVDLIKNAADIANMSVSQFLKDAAIERAQDVISKHQVIHLTVKGANELFAALENPPAPNKFLRDAAARYEERANGRAS